MTTTQDVTPLTGTDDQPTAQQLERARHLGRLAGRQGKGVLDCPYSYGDDTPPEEKVLALAWCNARRTVIPSSTNYEG